MDINNPDARERLDKIEDAIEAFKRGEFVIVVDDEDSENEGDFITAAELITPEKPPSHRSMTL